MKNLLKNHPVAVAFILVGIITVFVTVLSIAIGQHYNYRIYIGKDKISDINFRQVTEDGELIEPELVEEDHIEYEGDYILLYFNSVNSGSGYLELSYTLEKPDGEIITVERYVNISVNKAKILFIGDGVFNHNGGSVLFYCLTIYALLMIIYITWRRKYLGKTSRYTYGYISTWASQIFFTIIFIILFFVLIASLIKLGYVDEYLVWSVTKYMMLFITIFTIPIVIIFAISMTISNISLIRHEGKKVTNMLGILCGFGLLGAIGVIIFLFEMFLFHGQNNMTIAIVYSIANAFYIVMFSLLCGSIISGLQAGKHKPSFDIDYIIILGCSIRKDGTLYPLIRGRVDRAIEFWKEQELATGKKAVFVPSGGQGADEIISEGEAMKRYLLEQGISEEYILPETKSKNTIENMKFSKEIIEAVNPEAKIAFSTTNYHVMRSGILAGNAGLIAEGLGAPTKWYFWPNALLREVVGMLAYQPKIQLVIMIVLTIVSGFAGYAYYLMG